MNNSSASPALSSGLPTREEPDRDTSSEDASLKPPPSKKTRMLLRCDLCDLEFTSQIPYDMHLNGAKHAKKLKSENILKSLQEQGQAVQPQDTSNALRCAVCNVVANSSQQLQMHIEGNRHKQQCRKHQIDPTQYTKLPESSVQKDNQENGGAGDSNETAPKSSDQSQPPPAKIGKYYCETCQVSLNSENQLQQHMGSKKHQAQLEGKKLPGKKPWWWFKRKNSRRQADGNTDGTNNSENADSDKAFGGGGDVDNNEDFTFAHQESAQ